MPDILYKKHRDPILNDVITMLKQWFTTRGKFPNRGGFVIGRIGFLSYVVLLHLPYMS